MKRAWQEIATDDARAQWAGIYATLNPKGLIVINRAAYKRLGSPNGVRLMFDKANSCIGLKPASRDWRNVFAVNVSGRHGGRRINAYKLVREQGIRIANTIEFHDADIDEDGILILDLRTARISNRALNHPSRRKLETVQ